MDISAIEATVKTALETAGLSQVLTQKHVKMLNRDSKDLIFDKSVDPPRVDFLIVTVKRTGSERYASNQVLEIGSVNVEVFLGINEGDDTEATMRQRVDDVMDTLDSQLYYSGGAVRTLSAVASDHIQTEVKGFKVFKALVSQTFEVSKTVNYS